MSAPLLAYPNRADAATLSAGSWSGAFPLNNLKDGNVSKVTRSTNALAASTLFAVDLGASYTIRAIGLKYHNLTTAATVRYRCSNAGALPAGATNHDITANALQLTFQGDAPISWGRQYDVMDIFAAITARWLYIEVTDTANPAGYIEIGRLFIGTGLQPAKGSSYGLKSQRQELSTSTKSVSGKKYSIARRRPRADQFSLDWLTQNEANYIHEMQAEIGTTGEVLYVPDPADATYSQRFGGLGYISTLGALDFPHPLTRATPFAWEEKL